MPWVVWNRLADCWAAKPSWDREVGTIASVPILDVARRFEAREEAEAEAEARNRVRQRLGYAAAWIVQEVAA